MPTHTLTGNLGDLFGDSLDSAILPGRFHVYIVALQGYVVDGTEVRIGSVEVPVALDGTFSVNLADGVYLVEGTHYDPATQSGQARFASPSFLLDANKSLATIMNDASYLPAIPGLSIGTVTTGAPGTNADVDMTGGVIDFTIPRGNVGPIGPTGLTGPQGLSGTGSSAWVASTAVTLGAIRQAPDGSWIVAVKSRTTGASFNATERQFWEPVENYRYQNDAEATLAKLKEDVKRGVQLATDQIVDRLRPKKFLRTYTVDGSISVSEPANLLYKTYAEAKTAADTAMLQFFDGFASDTARAHPLMWNRIIVNPGNYNELLGVPNHCLVTGSTDDPTAVRFYHAGDAGSGAVMGTGGCTQAMVANLTVEYTGTDQQWHAERDSGPDGTTSTWGYNRRLIIFDNLRMICDQPGIHVETNVIDSTIGPSTVMIHNRCYIKSEYGPAPINMVLGTGSPTALMDPSWCMFFNCTIDAHHQANATWSLAGAPERAVPVGLVTSGGSTRNIYVWVGSDFRIGNPTYPAGSVGSGGVGVWMSANVGGGGATGIQYYIDPAIPRYLITSDAVTNRESDPLDGTQIHHELLLPRELGSDGMTVPQRKYFGDIAPLVPSKTPARATLRSGVASTARRTLTANRIYYVRVPVNNPLFVGAMSIGATFPSYGSTQPTGKVGFGWVPDNGSGTAPTTDFGNQGVNDNLTIVPAGDRLFIPFEQAGQRRTVYPGHKYVWLVVSLTDNTVAVDSVVQPTTGLVCVYKDGWDGSSTVLAATGLTTLPAAQPIPLPVLHARQENVQVLTGSTTITIPEQAIAVQFEGWAGGGGGGSGRRGAAGTVRRGGDSGATGGYSRLTIPTAGLPPTLSVSVGGGGAGGAAVSADSTDGNGGGLGGFTRVQANSRTIFNATGGVGGSGGTASAGSAAGAGGGMEFGVAGIAASSTGGAGSQPSAAINEAAGAGGSGGGLTSGNAQSAGGAGGISQWTSDGTAATAGTTGGGAGNAGASSPAGAGAGGGGAGGGSNLTGTGGKGGDGGYYGGGGGGGGASVNGNNSGAGGKGGQGLLIVTYIYAQPTV